MADNLIKPHGSDTLNPLYVADDAKRAALLKEAETLPSVVISSQAAANAVMLASGYFNPLKGFMGLKESLSVAEKMQTKDGLFWPVPIVNVVKDASPVKGAKPWIQPARKPVCAGSSKPISSCKTRSRRRNARTILRRHRRAGSL